MTVLMLQLIVIYAQKLFSKKSDMFADEQLCSLTKVSFKAVEKIAE